MHGGLPRPPRRGAVVHNHALFCTVMANVAVDELPPPRRPRRSSPHPGGALRGARLPGAGRLSDRRPGDGRAGHAAAQSRHLCCAGTYPGHDRRRLCGGGGPGGLLRLRPGPLHPTGRGGHSGLWEMLAAGRAV